MGSKLLLKQTRMVIFQIITYGLQILSCSIFFIVLFNPNWTKVLYNGKEYRLGILYYTQSTKEISLLDKTKYQDPITFCGNTCAKFKSTNRVEVTIICLALVALAGMIVLKLLLMCLNILLKYVYKIVNFCLILIGLAVPIIYEVWVLKNITGVSEKTRSFNYYLSFANAVILIVISVVG